MLSEKLLAAAFTRAVKHGTLTMITAEGREFTFGDGGEPRVTIRFTDAAAQMALCLHPELKLGELFVDGRLVIEQGTIFDLLQLLLQDTQGDLDELPLRRLRKIRHWMMRRSENDAAKAEAQRRPPLRSRRPPLRPLPRQRPAIFLRLFRPSGCQPRRGAAGQEAAHRGQAAGRAGPAACSISAPAGAAWGFISAQVGGRRLCAAASRSSEEQLEVSRRRAARSGPARPGPFRARGLPRHHRHLRPHRLGRHVRACGPALLRRLFLGLPQAS